MEELTKRSRLALDAAMYVKEAPIIMELINLNYDLAQGSNIEEIDLYLTEIEDVLLELIGEKIDSKELANGCFQ